MPSRSPPEGCRGASDGRPVGPPHLISDLIRERPEPGIRLARGNLRGVPSFALKLRSSERAPTGGHMRAEIVAALLVVAAPLASAQQPDASDVLVQRAKVCDAAAKGRRLSDEQYRSYMRACLASTERPQDLFDTARTIERRCNTIANDRQLTAGDRVAFMESCRRKGG
jgi:hypothetical protein